MIYLISNFDELTNRNLPFVFTDGHAAIAYTAFYKDPKYISQLNWDYIKAKHWNDTIEHPDRKRQKQAECLVYRSFPMDALRAVAVFGEQQQSGNSNSFDQVGQ